MILKELKPKKALNKAFLKVKPNRVEIEGFKTNLITLLDRTNDTESEEFHKNLVSDFLKDTYYNQTHYINTKGRNDLVIHNGQNANTTVGVIIEAKKPTNKSEMMSTKKLNVKAFQELVLYYLRERITHKNLEIKHLVATNINEWFIFDEHLFERLFAQNKSFVKQFENFEASKKNTEVFYKEIAEPFIDSIFAEIEFTYFNIQDYQKPLRNSSKADDNLLIALFKLLSPEHLLKLPFANDSNSLDKRFYSELLHIIGLTETKEGGKKIIGRNKEGERHTGSLLENAIIQLDTLDKISRLEKASQYGSNSQEKLFNVGLELSITWINRILFLKLLEAQLISYHKDDLSFGFLSFEKVKDYDDLNSLFFEALARKQNERNEDVQNKFPRVPYLNSSLFEPTDIEHATLFISQLRNDKLLPIYSQTVLKDKTGKKRLGSINPLEYLFEFLNAYDFSSEGSEDIQEDNKALINASVLGLIFEKINGYKDGSFFTPGFITMYMCRETIRKAVLQKFNETKKWNCTNLEELYDKIDDRIEANKIVNSLKICDPAVGSGHFLVSALNEIIAVKNDLKILQDRDGKRLKEYQVEVVNDELIVTDEEGELFEYHPSNKESQRIQETLFHEKQSIIESCLFGVDINPNSVKICRLRLWIELLKNAYYKNATELETLPNIDINIKCGNSLVSRFAIYADLKPALKKSKWSIDSYRIAVDTYRNAENKEQKREMERLINAIKNDFRSEISKNDPKILKLMKMQYEYNQLMAPNIFKEDDAVYGSKDNKMKAKERLQKLETEIEKQNKEVDDIKTNKIYENAFEWRFEFPEVLNDDGDFVGFDVVIGNPPYKMIQPNNTSNTDLEYFKKSYPIADFKIDLFHLFYQLGSFILKNGGDICFITPSSILNNVYASGLRNFLSNSHNICMIAVTQNKIFDEADVHTGIFHFEKTSKPNPTKSIKLTTELELILEGRKEFSFISQENFKNQIGSNWNLLIDSSNFSIFSRLKGLPLLGQISKINRGLISGDRNKFFSKNKETESYIEILTGSDILRYYSLEPKEFILFEKPKSAGGCWDKEVHLAPFKICIRQIGIEPTATLIQHPYAVTGNIFTIIHEDLDRLKYLLGIINSRFIKYFWKINFQDFKTTFPQVTINSLNSIPIKLDMLEIGKKIVENVDHILIEGEKQGLTIEAENEIDQLVYQLYELTEEEIAIIENN